jgi:hypothetical protein
MPSIHIGRDSRPDIELIISVAEATPRMTLVRSSLSLATWPPEVVAEMQTLRQQAEALVPADSADRKRLDYWLWTFDAFLAEAEERRGE